MPAMALVDALVSNHGNTEVALPDNDEDRHCPVYSACKQLACVAASGRRDFDAAQHAGDFFYPCMFVQRRDRRQRAPGGTLFADLEVAIRLARDLRQMRDAQHLSILPELFQQAADYFRDAAANPAIDFIKNQNRGRCRP